MTATVKKRWFYFSKILFINLFPKKMLTCFLVWEIVCPLMKWDIDKRGVFSMKYAVAYIAVFLFVFTVSRNQIFCTNCIHDT